MAARSQLPDRDEFRNWIAFNPAQRLSETAYYRIGVHEIGQMLGLQHGASATSVMYFEALEGPECLDPTDLQALAKHHKSRITTLDKTVAIGVTPPTEGSRK